MQIAAAESIDSHDKRMFFSKIVKAKSDKGKNDKSKISNLDLPDIGNLTHT